MNTLLAGSNALGAGSMSYTVTSYSETTVVRDAGGDGAPPTYETKTQSSFSTNVPGLAERVAEKGGAPPPGLLFPF